MVEVKDRLYLFILSTIIFLVFGFLQFTISLSLYFNAFGFFTCGQEYLEQWDQIRITFFLTLIFLFLQLTGCIAFIKKSKLESRFIWLIFPILTFVLSLIFLKSFMDYDKYYQDFDKKIWLASEDKPLSMIRTLQEEKTLHGLSRDQVTEMLGQPNCSYNIDSANICFNTEGSYSPLVLTFKNDTLVDLYLSCYD